MRKIPRRLVVASAVVLGCWAGLGEAEAQIRLPLVSITNTWRYNQDGTNLPVEWRGTNYDDSAWLEGRALLGVETAQLAAPIHTQLSLVNPGGSNTITYYFRTQFLFPTNPAHVMLIASNLIDDGAVIYLNGAEAARIGLPAGAPQYTTLANRTVGDVMNYDVVSLATNLLREGTNVLAAEVHQVTATGGSDVVWGLSLTAELPAPIVITNQPQSRTNFQSTTATFTVGASGTSPAYQWFKNGAAIPTANNRNYSVIAEPFAAGTYWVVVSNLFGAVISSNAVLTVVADFEPPTLVSAWANFDTTNVFFVTFSEVVSSTATNLSNYRITTLDGAITLPVTAAARNARTVRIILGTSFIPGMQYMLTVSGVRDVSINTNLITPGSRIFIAPYRELVSWQAGWRFFSMLDPVDLGETWRARDFDDGDWAEGPALFYFDLDDLSQLSACAGLSKETGTVLTYSPLFTNYYFRTRFQAPVTTGKASFRLQYAVDDGAVFYLNGLEVQRFNMPAGPITAAVRAAISLDQASCSGVSEFSVTNLVSGENVLAVEVHQALPDGIDVVLAAQLSGAVDRPLPPPRLRIVRAGELLTLEWDAPDFTLESATNAASAQWLPESAASPHAILLGPASEPSRFFRLRQ